MDDKEETALIEILAASCKQASSGQGPAGRAVRKVRLMLLSCMLFWIRRLKEERDCQKFSQL